MVFVSPSISRSPILLITKSETPDRNVESENGTFVCINRNATRKTIFVREGLHISGEFHYI